MLWNIKIQGRLEMGMNDAQQLLTAHEKVRKMYFSFLNMRLCGNLSYINFSLCLLFVGFCYFLSTSTLKASISSFKQVYTLKTKQLSKSSNLIMLCLFFLLTTHCFNRIY